MENVVACTTTVIDLEIGQSWLQVTEHRVTDQGLSKACPRLTKTDQGRIIVRLRETFLLGATGGN